MAETIRCPFCGGLNPAGAQWCGQCLKPFPKDEPVVEAPPPPAEAVPDATEPAVEQVVDVAATPAGAAAAVTTAQPGPGGEPRAFSVSAEGITWTCPTCETPNPIESDVCSVCGTTFAQMVHPEPERPERDPNTAALISLFYPGAGHAFLGMWSEAIARAVVSTWAVAVALIAAFAGEQASGRLITIMFGLVAFALWAVSAHDAYRSARHEKQQVILKGRGFLYLVLGLLGLLLLIVVGSALNAG
jgi:hypothetical protein